MIKFDVNEFFDDIGGWLIFFLIFGGVYWVVEGCDSHSKHQEKVLEQQLTIEMVKNGMEEQAVLTTNKTGKIEVTKIWVKAKDVKENKETKLEK